MRAARVDHKPVCPQVLPRCRALLGPRLMRAGLRGFSRPHDKTPSCQNDLASFPFGIIDHAAFVIPDHGLVAFRGRSAPRSSPVCWDCRSQQKPPRKKPSSSPAPAPRVCCRFLVRSAWCCRSRIAVRQYATRRQSVENRSLPGEVVRVGGRGIEVVLQPGHLHDVVAHRQPIQSGAAATHVGQGLDASFPGKPSSVWR